MGENVEFNDNLKSQLDNDINKSIERPRSDSLEFRGRSVSVEKKPQMGQNSEEIDAINNNKISEQQHKILAPKPEPNESPERKKTSLIKKIAKHKLNLIKKSKNYSMNCLVKLNMLLLLKLSTDLILVLALFLSLHRRHPLSQRHQNNQLKKQKLPQLHLDLQALLLSKVFRNQEQLL